LYVLRALFGKFYQRELNAPSLYFDPSSYFQSWHGGVNNSA
jgi:hypothetical protein